MDEYIVTEIIYKSSDCGGKRRKRIKLFNTNRCIIDHGFGELRFPNVTDPCNWIQGIHKTIEDLGWILVTEVNYYDSPKILRNTNV